MNFNASMWLTLALLSSGVAAAALAPKVTTEAVARPFAISIPKAFGDWKEVNQNYLLVDPTITRAGETSLNQPYDDILARTYQNSKGDLVMLALAYGRQQRQEVKIHRPDLCYAAQGFKVTNLRNTLIPMAAAKAGALTGKRMKAVGDTQAGGYTELVSYWIRIGSVYSDGAWDTRVHILSEGIAGRVPDGVLVRASRLAQDGQDEDAVHAELEAFLVALVAAAPADARRMLVQ